MERDQRRPDSWIGWLFAAAAVACLVAAAGAWHTWYAVEVTEPGGWVSARSRERTVFWLSSAGVAALAAGTVWAVRRWGHHDDEPPTTAAALTPGSNGSSGDRTAGTAVVGTASRPRLDWKAPTAPRPLHWTDRLRWVLAAGWLTLLVVALVGGARQASFDDAREAVGSGAVREVVVAGSPDPETGWATQDVAWREGLTAHRAQVRWPSGAAAGSSGGADEETTVIARDAADVLREVQPGLVVQRAERTGGLESRWLGAWMPAPQVITPVVLAGTVLTLFLILNAPPTWRLTRWAWFWVGFTPVGAVVFALLAGPTPGLPAPRHARQRIGGVVAFIASLVAAPLLHWGR